MPLGRVTRGLLPLPITNTLLMRVANLLQDRHRCRQNSRGTISQCDSKQHVKERLQRPQANLTGTCSPNTTAACKRNQHSAHVQVARTTVHSTPSDTPRSCCSPGHPPPPNPQLPCTPPKCLSTPSDQTPTPITPLPALTCCRCCPQCARCRVHRGASPCAQWCPHGRCCGRQSPWPGCPGQTAGGTIQAHIVKAGNLSLGDCMLIAPQLSCRSAAGPSPGTTTMAQKL